MTKTVAMFETSYQHIGPRLDALGLDIEVQTFDKDGLFRIGGTRVPAQDVAVDYLWLTAHINRDGFRDRAFEIVLGCKSIGTLQTFNAGLDHPFYKKISDKGTRICNSSAQGVAIAEYTLAQVLALYQPIELQRDLQARRQWQNTPFRELSQSSWLIVGFGPIGRELATRVKAFGARTAVVRRTPAASPLADEVATLADLGRLLPAADVIVLACSLNAATRGFAGADFFSAVKTGAILVNIARGGLIDDAALLAALDRGQLATAVLDVFHQEPLPAASPYWSHPQVRLTSHTSFAGSGVQSRWDQLFLDNVGRFARGEPLANVVDPGDLA
ncbi:MAG: NAD(P)-dependent oxidoreductase [Hyphomicrobiaceae bacterium]